MTDNPYESPRAPLSGPPRKQWPTMFLLLVLGIPALLIALVTLCAVLA